MRRPSGLCFTSIAVVAVSLTFAFGAKADEPATKRAQAKFEVTFLENMIDHHSMAVMMADLCEGRAFHPDLLGLCDQIMSAQTAEIAEMQGWLEDWYGITYEPQMTRKMDRQIESLSRLEGERFEIAFMQMMIDHHKQALREAKGCVRKAQHEELIELCENIISAQRAEIEQMESWLCDWYGRCRG